LRELEPRVGQPAAAKTKRLIQIRKESNRSNHTEMERKLIKGLEGVLNDEIILLCFPYAGGGASFYYRWAQPLKGVCRVCPVQLPGREERMGEPGYTSMEDAARDITDELEGVKNPLILFGHSMGTKLAYEVEKRLEEKGHPASYMVVSACPPPHLPEKNPIAGLPDKEFCEEIIKLNGVPAALAQEPELMKLFLPLLRCDFCLSEGYCCDEKRKVSCPIRALGGCLDREAVQSELLAWKEYNPSDFSLSMYEGDHFYIKEHFDEVLKEITSFADRIKEGIVA